jgi:ribosome-associated translation inhibitor RaiA
MHITVRAVDFVLTHLVRASVEERLAWALAWTGRQTARLNVVLSCAVGPAGQVRKRCEIRVHFPDGRQLVVDDVKADFPLAAERAANRIDRVLRHAGRRREARLSYIEEQPWKRS